MFDSLKVYISLFPAGLSAVSLAAVLQDEMEPTDRGDCSLPKLCTICTPFVDVTGLLCLTMSVYDETKCVFSTYTQHLRIHTTLKALLENFSTLTATVSEKEARAAKICNS